MAVEWLTVTQMGKAAGSTSSTAKKTIKKFSDFFEARKEDGVYRYADNSLKILKRIDELEQQGNSRDDIRNVLEKEYGAVKPGYEDTNGNGSYIAKDVDVETQPRETMLETGYTVKKTSAEDDSTGEAYRDVVSETADEISGEPTEPKEGSTAPTEEEAAVYKESAERILTREIVPMLREMLRGLAPDAREFVRNSVTVALTEAVRTVADQTSEIISLRNELDVIKDEMRYFINGNRLNLKDIENISEFNTGDRIIQTAEPGAQQPTDPDPGTYDMFPEFDVEQMLKDHDTGENFSETVRKIRDGIIEYGRYMQKAELMEQKAQMNAEMNPESGMSHETIAETPEFFSEESTDETRLFIKETSKPADIAEENAEKESGEAPAAGISSDQDLLNDPNEPAMETTRPVIAGYAQNLPYYETSNYKAAITDRVRDLKDKRGMSFSGIASKFTTDGLRNFEGDDKWTIRQVKDTYYAFAEA